MQAFLEVLPLRFHFTAVDRIHLPTTKSGNTFRGAIVSQLHSAPFVLRAAHLDGRTFEPGESFHLDLNVFDMREAVLTDLRSAIEAMARDGIGPGRGRARLESAESRSVKASLAPAPGPVNRALVRFLTPTELKSENRIVESPDFGVLFARARDRVSALFALYGAAPLDIDFKGLGGRAAEVRMTRCGIARVEVDRRSSRTGQIHSIGGFTGEAEYEGDLREFVPFLEAAYWTGVGRHTVWGNGWITVVRQA